MVDTGNDDYYVTYLEKVLKNIMPLGYRGGLIKGFAWPGWAINEDDESFRKIFKSWRKNKWW